MQNEDKLIILTIFHLWLWICFNGAVCYMIYETIFDAIDDWFYVGIACLAIKAFGWILYNNQSPFIYYAQLFENDLQGNYSLLQPISLPKYNYRMQVSFFLFLMYAWYYRFHLYFNYFLVL